MNSLAQPAPPSQTIEEVFVRLEPRLRSILGRYRIPFQDADDLLQDALLLLIRKIEELRCPEAYLLTTLQYRCLMYWRGRQRRKDEGVTTELLEDLAQPQAPSQDRALLRHDLSRLWAALPPKTRKLIWLRYGLGYTSREVAEHLGDAPEAIRQRSIYARNLYAASMNRHNLP
ncbi:MAG: sigma-70 family RNA polymerase sigma factor [Deltaproteobacteria bacterium]|nr:sigma-70 family RNA polymerase sigma factor [Deltaproteobacteria bacterium]